MSGRILVVDDDDAIRDFVEMALGDEGYEVVVAQNGLVALDIVKHLPVNLIILDMRMPIMDGWGFLVAYQDIPTPRAPVIAVSANHRAMAITTEDVVDVISKPFNLDDFLHCVKEHLEAQNGASQAL